MESSQASIKDKVYGVVKKIPEGRVTTYGDIAKQFKISNLKFKIDARIVGWMLHLNTFSDVPCHRVVDRNGRLAPNFGGPSLGSFGRRAGPPKPWRRRAFDGWREQKRRLEAEGVEFVDKTHVDLEKCFWQV